MRKILAILLILPFGLNAATVFTEFYCDSGVGTNINSGSTTNAAATYTSVNGNFNGSTTFTPTDGSTPASTVSAGDWAAIYIDGATNLVQASSGGYIVRVLSVAAGANGAITVSTTAFAGTAPSSSATGRSIKVGGAWNGPYGTIGFPFGFLATTATNAPNVFPRCNFKNTAQYNVTAAITHSLTGPIRFQGMTLTPGDFGKATIDAGTPGGAGYLLFTSSGAGIDYADLKFANNGNSGDQHLTSFSGVGTTIMRCVFTGSSRSGCSLVNNSIKAIECEAYACNKSAGANNGGFRVAAAAQLTRCVSHHNTGSSVGFAVLSASDLNSCISHDNGGNGVYNDISGMRLSGCDFYNNGGAGVLVQLSTVASIFVENCNFVKNTVAAITNSASLRSGSIVNCGLGSGTQANGSGFINMGGINEIGTITYAADVTPWTDPTVGDFRINLTAAKSVGAGAFTYYSTNSPTVAFPDIGAAQSASTNAAAAGGTTAHTFAQ